MFAANIRLVAAPLSGSFQRSGVRHNQDASEVVGMPAEAIPITGETPARRKPNKRRARVRIDRRFAVGRRAKELEDVFLSVLAPTVKTR